MATPTVPYLLLDVFTDTPFEGNPLAVAIDPPALADAQMQRVAAELNLSETIFLTSTDSPDSWDARIFTPAAELPFAGHPTVGAAVALALTGRVGSELTLRERAGAVAVEVSTSDADDDLGRARFVGPQPARLASELGADDLAATLASLGLDDADASTTLRAGVWSAGVPFTVVPLASVDALGRARPDAGRLAATTSAAVEPFLYVIAPDDDAAGMRWRARMFAAGLGIAEDPATGSAACALAGLLASVVSDGPASWTITQGVEMGRRSELHLDATVTSGDAGRPGLAGDAVLVGRGQLRVPT